MTSNNSENENRNERDVWMVNAAESTINEINFVDPNTTTNTTALTTTAFLIERPYNDSSPTTIVSLPDAHTPSNNNLTWSSGERIQLPVPETTPVNTNYQEPPEAPRRVSGEYDGMFLRNKVDKEFFKTVNGFIYYPDMPGR